MFSKIFLLRDFLILPQAFQSPPKPGTRKGFSCIRARYNSQTSLASEILRRQRRLVREAGIYILFEKAP